MKPANKKETRGRKKLNAPIYNLSIRLLKADFDNLRQLAEAHSMTVSAFARQLALSPLSTQASPMLDSGLEQEAKVALQLPKVYKDPVEIKVHKNTYTFEREDTSQLFHKLSKILIK